MNCVLYFGVTPLLKTHEIALRECCEIAWGNHIDIGLSRKLSSRSYQASQIYDWQNGLMIKVFPDCAGSDFHRGLSPRLGNAIQPHCAKLVTVLNTKTCHSLHLNRSKFSAVNRHCNRCSRVLYITGMFYEKNQRKIFSPVELVKISKKNYRKKLGFF